MISFCKPITFTDQQNLFLIIFLTACDVLHWYCACNVQCNTETFRTAVSYLTVVDASERISNIFPSDKAGFSLFFMFNGLYQEDFYIFE